MSTDITERNESVSGKDFETAYIKGCAEKKTREEIAASLGMKVGSFRTRESQVRKKWAERGIVLPKPVSQQGRGGSGEAAHSFEDMQRLLQEAGFTV